MTIPSAVRKEVDKLLAMYAVYKDITAQQADVSRQLAKAKLKQLPVDSLLQQHQRLAQKMQTTADAMTFASPLVWALYKFEAYVNEPQPIRTMQDFRVHCSKPGYICTKRFIFVNRALNKLGQPSLADSSAYPDHESLPSAFKSLHMLAQDNDFMKAWDSHEYFKQDGNVAKWENFAD